MRAPCPPLPCTPSPPPPSPAWGTHVPTMQTHACTPHPPMLLGSPPTPPPVWPYSRCWAAAGAGGHGAGEKRGQLVTVPVNREEVEREGSPLQAMTVSPKSPPPQIHTARTACFPLGTPQATPTPKLGAHSPCHAPASTERPRGGPPSLLLPPERGHGGFGDPPPQDKGHPAVPATPHPSVRGPRGFGGKGGEIPPPPQIGHLRVGDGAARHRGRSMPEGREGEVTARALGVSPQPPPRDRSPVKAPNSPPQQTQDPLKGPSVPQGTLAPPQGTQAPSPQGSQASQATPAASLTQLLLIRACPTPSWGMPGVT